jgi:hypothetical protein
MIGRIGSSSNEKVGAAERPLPRRKDSLVNAASAESPALPGYETCAEFGAFLDRHAEGRCE